VHQVALQESGNRQDNDENIEKHITFSRFGLTHRTKKGLAEDKRSIKECKDF